MNIALQPPEMASGDLDDKVLTSEDVKSMEIWTLGIILYYMTVGKYPFSNASMLE